MNTFSNKLKPYSYYACGKHTQGWNNLQLYFRVYRFKTAGGKDYLVYAEFYAHEVVAVKFCLRSMKSDAKHRFKFRTNDFDAFRVLATVIAIANEIYLAHPLTSFVFLGANDEGEPTSNTKRFRVYRKYAETFFSPDVFIHQYNKTYSSYFLLNRKSAAVYNQEDILDMFAELYDLLPND